MIAGGRHEHLRFVLEAPERLGVHDAISVPLEGSTEAAVRLRAGAPRRVGAGCERREVAFLAAADPGLERLGHRASRMVI